MLWLNITAYLNKSSFHFLVHRLIWPRPDNTFNGNNIFKSQVIYCRMSIRKFVWKGCNLHFISISTNHDNNKVWKTNMNAKTCNNTNNQNCTISGYPTYCLGRYINWFIVVLHAFLINMWDITQDSGQSNYSHSQ